MQIHEPHTCLKNCSKTRSENFVSPLNFDVMWLWVLHIFAAEMTNFQGN